MMVEGEGEGGNIGTSLPNECSFVRFLWHFICHAFLSLYVRRGSAYCVYVCVCVCEWVCLCVFAWHSENQIITFAYAGAAAAAASWQGSAMMTTTMTMTIAETWNEKTEPDGGGKWFWETMMKAIPICRLTDRPRTVWRVTFAVSDILASNKGWSGLNYTHNPGLGHFDCKLCEWLRICVR